MILISARRHVVKAGHFTRLWQQAVAQNQLATAEEWDYAFIFDSEFRTGMCCIEFFTALAELNCARKNIHIVDDGLMAQLLAAQK